MGTRGCGNVVDASRPVAPDIDINIHHLPFSLILWISWGIFRRLFILATPVVPYRSNLVVIASVLT